MNLKQYTSLKKEIIEHKRRASKSRSESETIAINALIKKCETEKDNIEQYILTTSDSIIRRVLYLRYIDNYTPAQIAQQTGNGYTAQYVRDICSKQIKKRPP